jgi:DedD protein
MAKDAEITVSTGRTVGLFVAFVIICASFFGFGYSMGRGAAANAANGSAPAVVVVGQRAPKGSPSVTSPTVVAPSVVAPSTEPGAANAKAEANSASGGQYFLQVAAVTKQEDAEALVSALRKKDYAVFATNSVPTDKLFHVQIGPFNNQKDVDGLRARLVSAGYNPIVKKQS